MSVSCPVEEDVLQGGRPVAQVDEARPDVRTPEAQGVLVGTMASVPWGARGASASRRVRFPAPVRDASTTAYVLTKAVHGRTSVGSARA
jgi:hypothetical protein